MAKKEKPKKMGRPVLPESEKGEPRTVRLNNQRYENFLKLGGREWLEKTIDAYSKRKGL